VEPWLNCSTLVERVSNVMVRVQNEASGSPILSSNSSTMSGYSLARLWYSQGSAVMLYRHGSYQLIRRCKMNIQER